MVTYIRSDLDFILSQIKIAEEHADHVAGVPGARPLFGVNGMIPANNISWGLRTVDGSFNNLIPGRTEWGAADQPFPELLQPVYRDTPETIDFDGPGPVPAMGSQSYAPSNDPDSIVVDSAPRTISNLIVDQSPHNPAAVAKALDVAGIGGSAKAAALSNIAKAVAAFNDASDPAFGDHDALQAAVVDEGLEMAGQSLVIPNVAPDEGLSAPFNAWFTFFGQFFDHGLDLVAKGESGTVFIPLQPDDPLFVEGGHSNFMVVTRMTVGAGADGVMGTADDVKPTNVTTPFVDQNQTYTSHPSHQVFLREYVMTADGPVATGNALDGPPPAGGLPTWGQIKDQAREMLGINLTDYHVGNLPLLATDPYGNFIPGPGGFPQVVMYKNANDPAAGTFLASGTPTDPLQLVNVLTGVPPIVEHLAVRTGHAFLGDINRDAVPDGKIDDGDITVGLESPGNGEIEYDNELLDAHFVTGDGRGNENIGLTAVHTVFHAEHNRLVQHTKDIVLAENDVAFLNEWLRVDVGALPTTPAGIAALQWDGERLFQAAKFGTEMQYQHLVFEEFARKIQPNIDVFLVPAGYDVTINPAIVAEFAHVVYRFGHSMLTETIDRFDADFNPDHISLVEGFLNPTEFLNGGTAEQAAGSIVRGTTRQAGNEIDEFVTGALQSNLLGLPLDLAAINIARGRDAGVPSLNAARREFFEVTAGNSELRPYDNWVDFADALKNPASIINFIAAYGTHDLITGESTVEGKRAAATAIVTGKPVDVVTPGVVPEGQIWTGDSVPGDDFDANTLVDDIFYNALYPDVLAAGVDPDDHYAQFGWQEGRDPNEFFSTSYYLATNPDVAAANINPLEHYAQLGWTEGRNPSPNFDGARYLLQNPDVAAAGINPLQHFLTDGRYEGREYYPQSTEPQMWTITPPADRPDFLDSTGDWASSDGVTITGLDAVDLWIGGLAEKNLPFGGMLGSTFNFVFEVQMEKLQNSDRFYYLQRLDGLHLFGEMENNSFAAMIMRNTDAVHLPSDVFSTAGLILEMDQSRQYNVIDGVGTSEDPEGGTILNPLVDRYDNTNPGNTNYLRYTGSEHVVLGGTDDADTLIGGIGDDAIYGDGGNDRIEGGAGNDIINGGDGDDIITDLGGDDNIKGGAGNDAINGGQGANLILGGPGKDFIVAGSDGVSEVFAGTGDDFILGSRTTERILGNEGNDWIEEGTFDGAPGDNFDEIFARDMVIGHDVFLGDGSTDEFIGEGGDDIFVGSAGINKLDGMSGFDWATYKNNPLVEGPQGQASFGVHADLLLDALDAGPVPPEQATLDQYAFVEGLSGSAYDDWLFGSEETANTIPTNGLNPDGSTLLAAHIGMIDGLDALLGNGVKNAVGDFVGGDIILGGGGSDLVIGRGGDDIIDGDKWLNVRISVRENIDGSGAEIESHDTMKTLVSKVFSGQINPGQLQIVREVLTADGTGSLDVAQYRGNRDEYEIEFGLADAGVRVSHVTPGAFDDGTDTLYNMEVVRFADGVEVFLNNEVASGGPAISDTSPTQGFQLLATPGNIADPNGITNASFAYQWFQRASSALPWVAIVGATSATFTPTAAQINNQLQVVATFTDDIGTVETAASAPTAVVGANFLGTNAGNTFNGTEGSDYAQGLGGNDTLYGNAGDDHLDGGAGSDLLDGGTGNDTLIGGLNNGADTLLGGAGDDTLDAGGGNDILDGGVGADTMVGGVGNDTYYVDDVGDVVIELANEGTRDIVFTMLNTYVLPDNVEQLFFTGVGTFTGTGNALNNQITGGDLDDILDGGAGNDRMHGGLGDDIYFFDSASDTAVEAVGGGIDTVYASVTDAMNPNIEILFLVEGAGNIGGTGNNLANTMTGNSGNNKLNGIGGDDIINGLDGNDTLIGGGGDDTLTGGAGNDVMNGGSGNDVFVFAPGFGNDRISGFDANPNGGQDLIDITAYNMMANVMISDAGSNVLITIGADTITLLGVANHLTVTMEDFMV